MHSGTTLTQFLVRTPDNELIRTQAFQCRLPGDKNKRVYKCQAFASLDGVEKPDLVVVGVKHYSLTEVLDKIEAAFGKDIPLMSVLNGVNHVTEISERFPNAFFATIAYNAYRTSPIAAEVVGGVVGLSSFKTEDKTLDEVHKVLKRKIRVNLLPNPLDAAKCKLVINLGNALLAIVAFHKNKKRELDVLQHLTSTILNEGVDVLKRLGVKEAKISGMPPWLLIRLTKILPQKLVLPIFEKKMKATAINSMAQDLEANASQTELEEINGYFLQMAKDAGVSVPYNEAVYHIFKQWQNARAEPLKPSQLLARINSFSNR